MGTQLLVFPLGPQDQVSIQFAHGRVERRTIVAPVILEPTPDDRIELRDRSSIALSLRFGSFQLRKVSRIAFAAWFETAGLKLMKYLPLRFFDRLG